MAGATTTTLNILQKNYQPGIQRQFNDDFPNLRYIRQNSSDITAEGDEAIINIETGLNEGGGFHGESADVPESGHSSNNTVNVRLKQMTFRLRITLKLMRKARTNAHSFAKGLQYQMSATRDAVTLTANQYLWGDGTGVMCRVKSETLSTNNKMKLDRAYALTTGGAPESIIRVGQTLHILDTLEFSTGVSVDRGQGLVANVDMETGTAGEIEVTITAGDSFSGVAVGDYVYLQDTIKGWFDAGESEDNRPAMGMLGFYSGTTVLQGLDPATEPSWKANEITIAQSTVIANLRTARNRVSKRVRRGRTAYVISSYETHERYMAELDTKVEFRNVSRFDSGWDYTNFYGRPWFMDHTAPDARAFFVPSGGFLQRYAVTRFVEFVDEGTGSMYQVPNKTVFDTMLTCIYEYGLRRRNALVIGNGMSW